MRVSSTSATSRWRRVKPKFVLAFRLYDPDHLLGDTEDLGITCALVPWNHPAWTSAAVTSRSTRSG